ncbi:MAG: hypothetical protein WAK82_08805, partial [Streptosporangiaceae bacterium]
MRPPGTHPARSEKKSLLPNGLRSCPADLPRSPWFAAPGGGQQGPREGVEMIEADELLTAMEPWDGNCPAAT